MGANPTPYNNIYLIKMAVAKITKSMKAILFIDDEGRVYSTSVNFMLGLTQGKSKHGFLLLSRLPFNISDSRFKESPLFDPEGQVDKRTLKPVTNNNDGLSQSRIKETEEKKSFIDKKVWK